MTHNHVSVILKLITVVAIISIENAGFYPLLWASNTSSKQEEAIIHPFTFWSKSTPIGPFRTWINIMEQWPHAHKVALITGGCGGLGKAISEAFLLAGANVVVCDINKQRIADFKENISPAYPECTLVLECDITDDSQIDKMFEEAEQMFGKVNYVINNAGMMDRFDPVGEMERTAWDRVIALNLTAPAMVTKRAVNHMIKNEVKGSIVNIASIAGTRGFTNGIPPFHLYSSNCFCQKMHSHVFFELRRRIHCI